MVLVKFADVRDGFDFVSADASLDSEAYVSLDTGVVHWISTEMDLEDEVPDDIETSDRYVAIPHRNDLDLGRALAMSFVDEHMPDEREAARDCFRKRGAYACFKSLLARGDALERWYEYERSETEAALRTWCHDNGISLVD